MHDTRPLPPAYETTKNRKHSKQFVQNSNIPKNMQRYRRFYLFHLSSERFHHSEITAGPARTTRRDLLNPLRSIAVRVRHNSIMPKRGLPYPYGTDTFCVSFVFFNITHFFSTRLYFFINSAYTC